MMCWTSTSLLSRRRPTSRGSALASSQSSYVRPVVSWPRRRTPASMPACTTASAVGADADASACHSAEVAVAAGRTLPAPKQLVVKHGSYIFVLHLFYMSEKPVRTSPTVSCPTEATPGFEGRPYLTSNNNPSPHSRDPHPVSPCAGGARRRKALLVWGADTRGMSKAPRPEAGARVRLPSYIVDYDMSDQVA